MHELHDILADARAAALICLMANAGQVRADVVEEDAEDALEQAIREVLRHLDRAVAAVTAAH